MTPPEISDLLTPRFAEKALSRRLRILFNFSKMIPGNTGESWRGVRLTGMDGPSTRSMCPFVEQMNAAEM
jgi:hypothetical protein